MTTSSVCYPKDYFEEVEDVGISTQGPKVTWEPPRHSLRVHVANGVVAVKLEGQAPHWFRPVAHALKPFENLGPNWDSYGALPVNAYSVASTIRVLASLMRQGTPVPALIASPEGNVRLEWHQRGIDLEIEVGAWGPLSAYYHLADGSEWEGDLKADFSRLSRVVDQLSTR